GSSGRNAMPLYHLFIEAAIDLPAAEYLVSINPARWMTGGKGLGAFRRRMMQDRRLARIVHFPGFAEVFPEVCVAGGVHYFLWDRDHNGPCEFVSGGTLRRRFLDEHDIVVQDNQALGVLEKVLQRSPRSVVARVAPSKPFGLASGHS